MQRAHRGYHVTPPHTYRAFLHAWARSFHHPLFTKRKQAAECTWLERDPRGLRGGAGFEFRLPECQSPRSRYPVHVFLLWFLNEHTTGKVQSGPKVRQYLLSSSRNIFLIMRLGNYFCNLENYSLSSGPRIQLSNLLILFILPPHQK